VEFDLPTVHDALAARLADREAIATPERRLSWAELGDRTRRFANLLVADGVTVHAERAELAPYESGQDAVALYLYNGHQYLEAMVGAFKARAVPCNVNYRYVEAELAQLLTDMAPRAIVFHGRFADRLGAVVDRLDRRPLLLQVDDGAPLLPGAVDYEAALAAAAPGPPPVEPTPDDLYALYTGGTTGRPKGVLWRQADVFVAAMGGRNFRERREWASVDELVESAAARVGPRVLSAAPFMHGTGQWVALQALHAGGSVVVPKVVDRLDPVDVLDTIEAERVTLLVIAGEAFARPLLGAMAARPRDLSSLVAIGSSGAALSPASVGELLQRLPQVRIRDTVGSSEAGSQAEVIRRAGDDGGPAGDGTFQPADGTCVIDDTRTARLAPGHDGTGWLARGGRVPLGYLGDPEGTARTFPVIDGVRMSVPGDRARQLADGRIELLGREATTINTGGEKVFAEEVEAAVRAHATVRDVAVVGRPSERWGSEVVALVQLEPGAELDVDGIVSGCADRLARYKLPKAVVVVDTIRRSPSGKLDLRWARDTASAAAGNAPAGTLASPS